MPESVNYPFLPIIYVRGYAATMNEIDEVTADPYMGFNIGSAMLRQQADKKPVQFIFESPLLRLIKDHGYRDAFRHGNDNYSPGTAPPRSVWIFRYYAPVSDTLGDGQRESMPQFAVDLRRFILRVRDSVCGDDKTQHDQFRVYLVAHSMGGLICRCYLQNICRHGAPDPVDNAELELAPNGNNRHYVDKVYTYGTPHNGIDFAGFNVPDLGSLDKLQVANFNRNSIRTYLKLPASADKVNSLDGAFPPDRMFCFIGSDYKDYTVAMGLSSLTTGAMSDGLVMMGNAYVKDAPRAVTYRSHSGDYGIVNSESGYQNLRRFLFGELQITATLQVDKLSLPEPVQKKKDAGADIKGSYYFDVATRVRNATTLLNERSHARQSAILKTYAELVDQQKPVYLFTGYLMRAARAANDTALMFAIRIAIRVPTFEVNRRFWFDEHFEGFLYQDDITFAVRDGTIRYGLTSRDGLGQANKRADVVDTENGQRELQIPLRTARHARPGFEGHLVLRVARWNVDD